MSDQQTGNDIRAAIRKGDAEKVAALIGGDKAILDMMTPFGTFLHFAANKGQLEIVKLLVSMGAAADVDGGISGGTALDQAASEGHLEIVRFLLDSGARMDTSVPEKNPLFASIVGGHTDVARLLIERGINTKPGADDPEETKPLSVARKGNREEIIALLTSAERN
ncbi:ankyrin repeat domain-containing protein [Paludisphaera mucosa]|uniref:Ankyrin repeat domain-containing protein n=1 Tax=Paludisphaera mucosa TaxID=3030827 RepID=A0ABT6FA80_9BACT|nr:ankyrin repeat domain-containing protein [Paludisphaera mucosa]MDG3004285.1 ankyrin repeat domain-containing protein [Paludisphaera mucosa]